MNTSADLADPLVDVRYRAPALAGSEVDYGLLADLTGFSVELAWILGHGLLARACRIWSARPTRRSLPA